MSGLLALLDDVAALAKAAAASLDDVAAQTLRAGSKTAGVVIDDTAVTPSYVTGLSPKRELAVVGRIALGSLRNKLLFLLPAALLLGAFAPWAIMPVLMLGGAYLCYEAAEKVIHAIWPGTGHHTAEVAVSEDVRVRNAVRTDFILSGEIMAITLGTVSGSSFWTQAVVLTAIGLLLTLAVYGVVALIVKADDAGLALARMRSRLVAAIGRSIVVSVPKLMRVLSVVGTAAMAWVGGGIILHGVEALGWHAPPELLHALASAASPFGWFVTAGISGALGLLIGAGVAAAVQTTARLRSRAASIAA